jgi:signal transduction histidine kinase
VRILLTGYADVNIIVDAINKGEIFRFINKPWNEFEMHNAIKNAYELYTVRTQLYQKVEELEKSNHELNRLVYSTSHDLRSPLASIISIINLAKIDSSPDDYANYFNMIESCATRMDAFILKIIEYYKSVRVNDEYSFIDFKQLVQESVDLCSIQNIKINIRQNVSQPVPFCSDSFRLSVILNNLLSNAVKYQKPAEPNPVINIKVNVNSDYATIIIEDNGIGIQAQNIENIFQMFFRSTKNATGLGIGLYIVQEAVSRIGGTIDVESEFGVGTTFYLQIPNRFEENDNA